MATLVKLAAFGEDKFFDNAFNYTLNDITAWLADCANGKKGGDRTKDENVKYLLNQIQVRLLELMQPNGAKFTTPPPKSHFLRDVNPNWTGAKQQWDTEVKFVPYVLLSAYQGAQDKTLNIPWWNPYDLLGFFLSVLGPAPAAAKKNNYFLPLCAVYARWCARIAGRPQPGWKWTGKPTTGWPGKGDWPYMYSVIWRPEGREATKAIPFFLGSSTGGDEWTESEVGQWRTRVQRQRFDILYHNLQMSLFPADSFDKKSSIVQSEGTGSQCYGNCAETYPFIFNIRKTKQANRELRGLALKKDFMKPQSLNKYDPVFGGQIWSNLCGPCGNCWHIVRNAGVFGKNFGWRYEEELAPKKATTALMDNPTTTPAATAATDAPEGWSSKAEDLNATYYWGTDGAGTAAAQKVGLNNPQGLYIADLDNGGDRYIFKDGTTGKIYVWSMLTDEIFEFTKPTTQDEIIAQLKLLPTGKGSVETKQLHDVA